MAQQQTDEKPGRIASAQEQAVGILLPASAQDAEMEGSYSALKP
jgi:hypothetical protein